MNLPSLKTLSRVFSDAKQARRALEMTRAQLLETDAGNARVRGCYTPPRTYDIRLHVLNALEPGLRGVEAFQCRDGGWCEYLNAGDPYAQTLIYWRGRYSIGCWGDIAERIA